MSKSVKEFRKEINQYKSIRSKLNRAGTEREGRVCQNIERKYKIAAKYKKKTIKIKKEKGDKWWWSKAYQNDRINSEK